MRIFPVLLYIFSFFTISQLYAQQPSRTELENRRVKLLNEIAETQQQLADTKKDKTATMGQLKALTAKLNAREKLISNINAELDNIDGNIRGSAREIELLNKNLDILRANYARSIRYAYKHRESQQMIAFLFSAQNFNDAIRRMQYLKKYRDYRKDQADKIRVTQDRLAQKIGQLNAAKTQKGALLQVEEQQKKQIQQETQQTNAVVLELKGKEKELMEQIQKNQKSARRIEATIKEMIRKEIELARKKAEEEARKKAAEEEAKRKAAELAKKRAAEEEARKKAAAEANADNSYAAGNQKVNLNTGKPAEVQKPPVQTKPAEEKKVVVEEVAERKAPDNTSYKLNLTPEVQAVSNSFAANRGRLPWPVEKGFVSGKYGRHPHPLFPKVTIDNIGIDISTGEGAQVRAVFDGTVTRIANIDGNTLVMISHGEYFTIYTNLSSATVAAGAKVKAKQAIGRAGKNSEGENMMQFQVWRVGGNNNITTVNPEEWIAR